DHVRGANRTNMDFFPDQPEIDRLVDARTPDLDVDRLADAATEHVHRVLIGPALGGLTLHLDDPIASHQAGALGGRLGKGSEDGDPAVALGDLDPEAAVLAGGLDPEPRIILGG